MLEIRLLGDMQVLRDGRAIALPASKKSRALLAYLAATGTPHLREHLCDLLWEGPDDPRAALRWSLTKLRPIAGAQLHAMRDRIQLKTEGALVDIARLCVPGNATTVALEECAELFRGQFLDGLELPACFRFQQWCAGERERLRQAHVGVLRELTKRYGTDEKALRHARRRVMADPFSDDAHAALIRLLAQLGQAQDALRQYEHCRQMFERELGTHPGMAIEEARRAIGRAAAVTTSATVPKVEPRTSFVGRSRELDLIISAPGLVVISGEPGIGKSRLLDEVRRREPKTTIYGHAFAAEMVRPYGVWIDALRTIGRELPDESDRSRLFDAVVDLLSGVALVGIDDLQWIDEASAALVHYVARSEHPPRIVMTARSGEIDDNAHASRLLQELERDHRLTRIDLTPLSADDTRALAAAVAPAAVVDRVVAQSGGNPLFAIELARSGSATPATLSATIRERLAQVDGSARELVSWAAAIGHSFDIEIVGRATGMSAGEMLSALDRLERLAILRVASDRTYDFTHDLVRDAAYQMISGPRRTLVHRNIARALRDAHDPQSALAGEIVHHAFLAGDFEQAATAAVAAGRRCLRMFAYAEAVSVSRRGLQIVESLPQEDRLDTEMRLLQVIVMARTPIRERSAIAGHVSELLERARAAGLAKTAALGANLLAILNEEMSNYERAADASLQSAEMSRGADTTTAALLIANTARCLLVLQRDISRAESLLAEAQAMGIENIELELGWGYLHAHYGRTAAATPHFERALQLAVRREDHWREWLALARLVTMALEDGCPELALSYCQRLRPVADKMGGGSEGARTVMLETLARYLARQTADVESMLGELRAIDSKSDLAWALAFMAELELERGEFETAREHAAEALDAAAAVGRQSEVVIARAVLDRLPGRRAGRAPRIEITNDLTARARKYLKEKRHGHSRAGAHV